MTEVTKEIVDTGVVISASFKAPRELVFRAHSESELLRQWWGPEGFPVSNSTMDFRVGGTWLYSMRSAESGEEFWSKAVYHEIVVPEKIVWTDAFCDAEGKVNEEMPQGTATVTFTEQDGVTTVRSEIHYADNALRDAIVQMGMLEGMTITLNQLETLLETLKAA
ncbi:SRPBCC domain-containing protein [Psychromicrobium sp. YIM B11713]|uniref:SRPBCC domain-containing protein n=1 Tax=Psychromicrobium sp. YIM B11713 TaxID=3145233 RepID=UPI00374F8322